MTGFIWIPVTFLGLFNLVIFGLSFVPRYQERTAERLARSVALILTPEVLPMVRRRVAQRTRGTTIGMVFAGLSVGVAVTGAISGAQLRGDEVLRSTLHRDLAIAPIALGFYGFNVAMYAAILIGIFVIVSKPQRYFRLRLWPDLAEGL